MVCRLIDERYPDYENVIPSDNSNSIEVDKSEILSSLKRISIYANKTTNQVRLKVAISLAETRGASDWIEVDSKKLEGTFLRHPERKELPSEINESLIVELYSK